MNNENMSSGKGLTLVKTTLLSGQERVTVVASLPTNQSCDVTANIPIVQTAAPCRCFDGHVKEPFGVFMALGARP